MLDNLDIDLSNDAPPGEIPTPKEQPNPDTFPDPAHDPHTNPPQDPVHPQPGDEPTSVHG